ncbi:unnamed protein product, partial [marine sediment metagenome]
MNIDVIRYLITNLNYENNFMGQPIRYSDSTGTSFGDTLRKRIQAAMAVDKLNDAVAGKDVTVTQLAAIRIALGKCLELLLLPYASKFLEQWSQQFPPSYKTSEPM